MTTMRQMPANVQPGKQAAFDEPAFPPDIIVADDELAIAECIADVLAEEGYRVRVFHDGASALDAIAQQPPKLVLLDVSMPVMGGDEVLAAVRRSFPELPVILMSAGARLADFLNQGAAGVLAKPFELEHLLHYVKSHILYSPTPQEFGFSDQQ